MNTKLMKILAIPVIALSVLSCKDGQKTEAPTVSLTIVESTHNSVTFTLAHSEADRVTYMLLEGTGATPDAATVVNAGIPVDAASTETTVSVSDLTPESSFTVVAAAVTEGVYSQVATAQFSTGVEPILPDLGVTITGLLETRTGVTVTYECTPETKAVAYRVLDGTAGTPTAESILTEGTVLESLSGSFTLTGLTPETSYNIVMAASGEDNLGNVCYSALASEWATTLASFLIDADMNVTFDNASIEIYDAAVATNVLYVTFSNETTSITLRTYKNLENNVLPVGSYTVIATANQQPNTILAGRVYSATNMENSYVVNTVDGAQEYGAVGSGTMTVNENGVTLNFTINGDYTFTGTYSGTVAAEGSKIGSQLTDDYHWDIQLENVNTSGAGDRYLVYNVSWTELRYVCFCILDADGNKFEASVIWDSSQNETNFPVGTFEFADPQSADYPKQGTLLPGKGASDGFVSSDYDRTYGTGMEIRMPAAEGYNLVAAPACEGTVTVTANDDGTHTLSFDLYDDVEHNITGTFTGTLQPMWF